MLSSGPPSTEPWVASKERSEASRMEQVELSCTGESCSAPPPPGEKRAVPRILCCMEASSFCSRSRVSSLLSPGWLERC